MNTARSRGSRVNELPPAIVRLAQGSLMAGHGAQKLFGSFGGPGLEGTSGFMEMLGMRRDAPGPTWRGYRSSAGACSPPWGCSTPWDRSGS